jgi:hypothetical protein
MTAVQIFALSTPVVALLFMGLIALVERRYNRAPVAPESVREAAKPVMETVAAEPAYVEPGALRAPPRSRG